MDDDPLGEDPPVVRFSQVVLCTRAAPTRVQDRLIAIAGRPAGSVAWSSTRTPSVVDKDTGERRPRGRRHLRTPQQVDRRVVDVVIAGRGRSGLLVAVPRPWSRATLASSGLTCVPSSSPVISAPSGGGTARQRSGELPDRIS